ncbi:MAG TPA: hypothetical protein V6C97_30605 [Oculatellaceae cyanobacterium]
MLTQATTMRIFCSAKRSAVVATIICTTTTQLLVLAMAAELSDTTSSINSAPSSTASHNQAVEEVQFPATTREQALIDAKKGAGRLDPLAPLQGFKPFPSSASVNEVKETAKISGDHKYPSLITDANGKVLVPPPPPVPTKDEFPVSELPLPPDRPSLAAKMKLTGVIGDTAVFAFSDKQAARQNHWPQVLMLNAGDRFETVDIVSVHADSAVLEEDGTRSIKTLERIGFENRTKP